MAEGEVGAEPGDSCVLADGCVAADGRDGCDGPLMNVTAPTGGRDGPCVGRA